MKIAIIAASLFGGISILWIVNALWARHRINKALKVAHEEAEYGKDLFYSESMVAGLPEPVVRYFRHVLNNGQKFIRFATVKQNSQYKMTPTSQWIDVDATCNYATGRISLVWDATLHDRRYMWRRAQLIYLHTTGEGLIKLYGGLTLSEYSGSEADLSLLFRFLSEALLFPTALLPGGHVTWKAHGPNTAEAMITDDDLQCSALFHFNEVGEVEKITTGDKYRDFKGGFHKEGFVMHCRNYRTINNVLVPTELEFVWQLSEGDFSYAKIGIENIAYA